MAAIVRRPTSPPRLLVEAVALTLAVIGLVWLAWAADWVLEQRRWILGAPRPMDKPPATAQCGRHDR